jgi:NAD(P)-dependent dehydrogenase (short-subunit alcohol dehydrogenase family)
LAEDDHSKVNPVRRNLLAAAAVTVGGLAAGVFAGFGLGRRSAPMAMLQRAGAGRFEEKVVVITGATSGIGRAAALAFAREGGRVVFCGRREGLGREVEAEIRAAGGQGTYVRADVTVEDDVRTFVARAMEIYGRLDVAFNNAGITIERALHDYSAQEWDQVVATNLRGVFLAIKYQIPHMIAAGGGTIVVTSSSNAIATRGGRAAYTASKRALIGLVQSAALEYAGHNIRINTLIPGTTDTALVRRAAGMEGLPDSAWRLAMAQWARTNVPGMQRLANPEEIAAFALALASDEFPYMTGASLVIDGGKTAHA